MTMAASNIAPTEVDWEEHKAAIHRLFLVEKQTLVDLQRYLEGLGIRATSVFSDLITTSTSTCRID